MHLLLRNKLRRNCLMVLSYMLPLHLQNNHHCSKPWMSNNYIPKTLHRINCIWTYITGCHWNWQTQVQIYKIANTYFYLSFPDKMFLWLDRKIHIKNLSYKKGNGQQRYKKEHLLFCSLLQTGTVFYRKINFSVMLNVSEPINL